MPNWYPRAVEFSNPGMEVGSPAGFWGSLTAAGPGVQLVASANFVRTGSYAFIGADASSYSAWGQYVDLPASLYDHIDMGVLHAKPTVWIRNSSFDLDRGILFSEAHNENSVFLGGGWGAWAMPKDAFEQSSASFRIPKGTRKILIGARSWRNSGTQLSIYYDDFALEIEQSSLYTDYLYADVGSNITGWTVTSGPGQPVQGINSTNGLWKWHIFPGSTTLSEHYKQFTIPASYQAAVSSSHATALLGISQGTHTVGDWGGIYISFVTSDGTLVSSHGSGLQVSTVYFLPFSIDVTIPVSAALIRAGLVSSRASGQNCDAYWERISLAISAPNSLAAFVNSDGVSIPLFRQRLFPLPERLNHAATLVIREFPTA